MPVSAQTMLTHDTSSVLRDTRTRSVSVSAQTMLTHDTSSRNMSSFVSRLSNSLWLPLRTATTAGLGCLL